jgi:hypothetical protein
MDAVRGVMRDTNGARKAELIDHLADVVGLGSAWNGSQCGQAREAGLWIKSQQFVQRRQLLVTNAREQSVMDTLARSGPPGGVAD